MPKYLYILSISLTCFLNSTLLHGQANDSLQIVHQLDSIYKITLQTVGNGQLNEAIALAKEGLNLSISQSKGFTKKQVKFYSIVARIYHQMGDFENAKFNYLKAIGILENDMYSKKAYSELLHDLGILYINVNSLDEAEQMLRKSLDLSEQLNGRNSSQYAESLLGFAPFQIQKGNFTVADSIFSRAIEILKSIKDTITVPNADLIKLYAFGLYAYGNFLHMRGEDQKSEKYYLNSRDLYAENYISDSIHYGELLVDIGIFYFDRGDFTQAEDYLKTSIEIGKSTIGENHPNYGARLEVLANLYGTRHLYQKAINLYYEVGRICIINYGENCMDYIRFLMNQGTTYYLEHKLDSADLYQSKALAIYNKLQIEKDDTWAKMLNDIGSTKSELGQFHLADSLFKEVNHFCESSLGTNSDIYLQSLINLGINASRAHDYEKSKNYFSQSRNLYQNHVINSSSYATESELQAFINLYLPFNDIYSSFSFEHADPQLTESLYNMALFDKGYVLNEIKMIKRKLESDTIAQNLYTKLSSIRYEIASLYSHPLNEANQIHVLEENCNQIEKVIVTRSIDFSLLFEPTTWINVQAQLKNDEAAIEFIHFNLYKEMRMTDSILYCAILIRPNLIHPVFIPLFESRQFNKPNALTSASKSAFFEDLYGNEDAHLYHLIWEPLESQLIGCKVIYFSPSGLLYTVNLGAIMRPNHEIISSAYDLVSLGSTREIILNKVQPVLCSSMSMFAGITYDIDTTMIKNSVDYSMEIEKEDETINSIPFDNTLRGGNWSGLPGSMTEMNNIVPILERNHLQVKVSSQNMATEEKFKDLGRSSTYKLSPDIIHISTHGFFFPDPIRDSPNKDSSTLEPIFKVSNNPMLRSGLILAGGNYAWTYGHPFKPDMEDGILTAYEISQMDLSNTELVVLSACETGLGDIEGNEGVYGLQRAFKIAGVKNLIMSLWQVPDAATAELMTSFYKHWLEDKMTIRDALHAAQKEMRKEGWEVYDWAGFILVE